MCIQMESMHRLALNQDCGMALSEQVNCHLDVATVARHHSAGDMHVLPS